jgi:hypothetical protein
MKLFFELFSSCSKRKRAIVNQIFSCDTGCEIFALVEVGEAKIISSKALFLRQFVIRKVTFIRNRNKKTTSRKLERERAEKERGGDTQRERERERERKREREREIGGEKRDSRWLRERDLANRK